MQEYGGPVMPVSRTDVARMWTQVARIRERNGDKKGAARARRNAKIITGLKTGQVPVSCRGQRRLV